MSGYIFRKMGTPKDTMSGIAFLFEAGGRAVSGREVWLWAGACRACCNVAAAVEDGRGQKGTMCRQLTSGWRPTFPITPSGWCVTSGCTPIVYVHHASAEVQKPDGCIGPKLGAQVLAVLEGNAELREDPQSSE